MKSKKKIEVFPIVNGLIFIILSLLIIIPMWKVLVDSFDLKTAYGMKLSPGGIWSCRIHFRIQKPYAVPSVNDFCNHNDCRYDHRLDFIYIWCICTDPVGYAGT